MLWSLLTSSVFLLCGYPVIAAATIVVIILPIAIISMMKSINYLSSWRPLVAASDKIISKIKVCKAYLSQIFSSF
jgi:hypothetical protein